MIEHSIKLMYIAVSTLLLVIALTSFYSHEKKFMQFFRIEEEARKQSSWLKEADHEDSAQFSAYELSRVQAFQKATEFSSYIFTGKEMKAHVYGSLLYQGKKLNQEQGIHLTSSLTQLLTSEETLEMNMTLLWDGVVVTQHNAQAFFSGIEENAFYGLRYIQDENKMEIVPID